MPTPVYPVFPSEPDPGDTFTPQGTSQVWTYLSDEAGWTKTVIELQDRNVAGEFPIWPGRIIDISGGGGGGGGGGG